MTFEGTPNLSLTLEATEAFDKHNALHFNPTRLTKWATGGHTLSYIGSTVRTFRKRVQLEHMRPEHCKAGIPS